MFLKLATLATIVAVTNAKKDCGEVAKDNCHEGWAVHKGHLTQANAVYFCGAASETSCIVGCNADGDDVPEDRRMNSHDKKAEMCVENCGDNGLCSEACTQYFNYLAGCMTTQNEGEFANVAAAASERVKSKGTSLLRGDDDPVVRNATPMLFCGLWAGF